MNLVNVAPKVEAFGRYPIGQAAALLGIDRKTLRYWSEVSVRQGGIRCDVDRQTARKWFKSSDIVDFWERRTGLK